MNILVVGAGGRAHALAWKLARHGHRVVCAPGNPGAAQVAECVPVALTDVDALARLALEQKSELVVIGPEAPLVAGLGDRLRAADIAVFGPGAQGARLEGSKAFCKAFLTRNGIRTAPFHIVKHIDDAARAITEIDALGTGVVIKADGLAGGKGVVVCPSVEQAGITAREFLAGQKFGSAGETLVVEQRIHGRELSAMALVDGQSYRLLAPAQDHKPLGDGDIGPHTGGMGAVSPCAWVDGALLRRIEREIFTPTLAGLRAQGIDYRGLLYAGLMVDTAGAPWVLEYNCRFGDPEVQTLVVRLRDDLALWLAGAARGELPRQTMDWDERTAVCVVLASEGYPERAQVGRAIRGDLAETDSAVVFHAGTAVTDSGSSSVGAPPSRQLVTAGGRVLGVTALGPTTEAARERAYRTISGIEFTGMHYRTDIGARAH